MNPIAVKALAAVALIAGLVIGYIAWHHYVFQQGVEQEKGRRDRIDAKNAALAQTVLAAANERVRLAQAKVAEVMQKLSDKQKELSDAKAVSSALQSDLLASRKRLSVLVTTRSNGAAEQAPGSATAGVDQGAEVTAELNPEVAAGLVELVSEGDQAIARLGACISAYEAVEHASK